MTLGINGYSGHFSEIHTRRKLEEVRNRIKRNFRNALLTKQRRSQKHE
jgi:hypothetical protein